MSTVTIEKGQHLTMLVEGVEETPSKNPNWDSRWRVSGAAGGAPVTTYIGNKGMMQQLSRAGISAPEALVGSAWTFERTVEGYLNIIPEGGRTKTPPANVFLQPPLNPPVHQDGTQVPKNATHLRPFDEPVDAVLERRKRVASDILWAFAEADSIVAATLKGRDVEYTVEALRSVTALAATIHISYKEAR